MDVIGPLVALVLAAAVVALVMAIGKDTGAVRLRVLGLTSAIALLTGLNVIVTNYSRVFYVRPLWLTGVLVVGWVGLFVLIIVLTRTIRQYRGKVLLLGVLLLVSLTCATMVLVLWPFGAPTQLFLTRAQQIAKANGFELLVPADEALDVSAGLPVNPLPAPDAGVALNYERFLLQERAAAEPMTESDLKALVASGESPLGDTIVPADAELSTVTVNSEPAVAAVFEYAPPEAASKPAVAGEVVTILVLQVDGVDVRFESRPGQALTVDELVEIASSLSRLQ